MGWFGIPSYDVIVLGVPVLLIGISVDYAIHTFMRHREERESGDTSRVAMRRSLVGVGAALLWVTLTAELGFLSNLSADLAELRAFGVATTLGLAAALLVFTTLVPALKIEIDGLLARIGRDRVRTAFGSGDGRFGRLLTTGATAARRAPVLVLALALVVSSGAAYGAVQLDASADEEFLADDPPAWMSSLPEPFKPTDYTAKEKLTYVGDNFRQRDRLAGFVLLEGAITDDRALERMAIAEANADDGVFLPAADGASTLSSPLSVMQRVAAADPGFATAFDAADTDRNGVPDRDVTVLYDGLFEAAPEMAGTVLERTDSGEYVTALIVADPVAAAGDDEVTGALRSIAADLETGDGVITAVPTGDAVIISMTIGSLVDNVIVTLLITLVAVNLLLVIGYRITVGSASLGFVTLLPVAFGVSWFFGTLWLVGEELTLLTSIIASLTVGLGVDYSIHLGERYRQELDRQPGVWPALYASMRGTGGALFGGFVTSVAAFATLGLATMPQLQQFGILVALALVYAFLSTVLVLPSLLIIWTRYFGPAEVDFETPATPDIEVVPTGADD
ncbi:MAG: MMPL family transporter [Halapricum sp.]